MRIYITDKNEEREITLKAWNNKYNDGWSPDVFGDLADTMPRDYPVTDDMDTDAACAMTDKEYRETVEWWEREISLYNAHDDSSWFVEQCFDLDAEWDKGLEYRLFADDVNEEETERKFTVLPRYRDLWSNDPEWDGPTDMAEIERLAREWDKPVEELLEQVEEV